MNKEAIPHPIHSVSPSPKSSGLNPSTHPHTHITYTFIFIRTIRKFTTNDCNAQMHKDWNHFKVHTRCEKKNPICKRTYTQQYTLMHTHILLINTWKHVWVCVCNALHELPIKTDKHNTFDIYIDCINWFKPQIHVQFILDLKYVCLCLCLYLVFFFSVNFSLRDFTV